MNTKLLNHIQKIQNTKGYVSKVGFDLENVFIHIKNFAWGLLLCALLSMICDVSFYMLLSLTLLFHVVGTGVYKYKVPYMDVKKVDMADFNGLELSLAETESILIAQKKGLKYKQFFKDVSYINQGFFVV